MSEDLAKMHCIPCKGGIPPMDAAQIAELQPQLSEGWQVVDNHHLAKTWTFDDFAQGLAFTNQVGAIAESEAHHPDIYLAWGKVRVEVWTHAIDGLALSDFVLAARIDDAA